MADPISLTLISTGVSAGVGLLGMGASAAGAATQAYGQAYSGAAQKQMYDYQSAVAQINKRIAEQNAKYEIQVGGVQAEQTGMAGRFQIGTTRAAQGASNLDVNAGSAAEVRHGMSEVAQQNQGIVRASAARRAYGYTVEAATQEAQTGLYTMAGRAAAKAGDIGAQASILGGVANVSSKWLQFQSSFGNPLGSTNLYNPGTGGGTGGGLGGLY